MKKIILCLVLGIQLSVLCTCQNIGTYHVSKVGADTNPGTLSSPFLTLSKAAKILEPGDVCIVHSGTYRECFAPQNNGTSEKPIALIAAEGEKVIITGMETLKNWKKAGRGIFKARATWDLGESNFVLIDGKMGFEARFPNKTNDDPFDIEGGTIIEEGVSKLAEGEDLPNPVRFISETSLPDRWTTRDLSDAKVWVLAHRKWSAWTAPVTGYDPKEQLIWFKEFPGNQISSNYNPNWLQRNYGRGVYYMFGSMVLLDSPNEWYFNKMTRELYVMVSGQKKPAEGQVEFRKRELAVDLRDKAFWEISGFVIKGATIDMSNAENCTVNDCKISNYWQSVPAQSARAMTARSSGIAIGGENNTIKNSEISYSAGAGITLSGQNNVVANNLIHHTNYLGSISTGAMRVSGFNNQIIYNTIHTTGRDIIKLHGAGSVIAWNHLYNPGLICYDLGIVYSGGQDYRNTLIHHNLVHNDQFDHHPCNGIYFDNYTNNGIVHHNIIWGNIRSGVRLNRPGNYHQVFNNTTVSIDNRYGPWKGPAVQFGSSIVNNYSVHSIMANEEVFLANNAQGFPYDTLKLLPQVTEPSEGFDDFGFPDYIGAVSNNSDNWTVMAGHDFDRSSIPPADRDLPFMRNYTQNGSFDWGRDGEGDPADNTLGELWEKTGALELSYSPGFHHPAPSIRNSVYANSLLLKSKDAGISQRVKGLQPDFPYKVGVYVRPYEKAEAILSVQSTGGSKEVSSEEVATVEGWKLLVLAFRTGPEDTEVRVRIGKTGEGEVYLDNIGLVPDLAVAETESAQKEPAKLIYSGRLAVSHDGNIHDQDDWGALAFVWGIVASFGMQENLVHVDHSDHLVDNTVNGEKQMILSAEGWNYFPGFDSSIVFNAWRDLDGAIANFKKQAEAGSENDILSYMCAGPMEVPWQCINAVTPSKRKFIRVISHSGWNNNHTWKNPDGSESHTWDDMISSFSSDGVKFEKIPGQNGLLGPDDNDWSFLNDMPDNSCIPASAWKWMLSREQKHGDVSDCGMTWYCLTGDASGTGAKFEARFKDPIDPVAHQHPEVFQLRPDDITTMIARRGILTGTDKEDQAVWGFDTPEDQVAWIVNAPKEDDYTVSIIFSMSEQVNMEARSGESVLLVPSTIRTWENRPYLWRQEFPGTLHLKAGENRISFRLPDIQPAKESDDKVHRDSPKFALGVTEDFHLFSIELGTPAARKAQLERAQEMKSDASWMKEGKYGLFVHWSALSYPFYGDQPRAAWFQKSVEIFDVKAFADAVEKTGAAWVNFTATHKGFYWPAPNAAVDKILPGRTSKRDLLGEIIDELGRRGIRTLLYLHTGYNGYESEFRKASGASDKDRDHFSDNIEAILRDCSLRYGKKLSGFGYIDGALQFDYPLDPHFESWARAIKAGNSSAVVGFSSNRGPVVSPFSDLSVTDGMDRFEYPDPMLTGPGCQLGDVTTAVWCYMDGWFTRRPMNGQWRRGPSHSTEEYVKFFQEMAEKSIPVSINMIITADVTAEHPIFNPKCMAVMEKVRKAIRGK